MGISYSFKDNRDVITDRVLTNFAESADEIKEQSIEWTREQMVYGYPNPVYDTGATFDSVNATVQRSSQNSFSVTVGTGTDYTVYVHNGTYKMAARPFIRDALEGHISEIAAIVGAKLKAGF